jgi:hypothetical protein
MHVEHTNVKACAAFRETLEKSIECLIFGYLGDGKLIRPREEGDAVSRDMFRYHNARQNHNTKMANSTTNTRRSTNVWGRQQQNNLIYEEIKSRFGEEIDISSSEALFSPSSVYKRKDYNTKKSSFTSCF